MHSGVFATTARAAGDVARRYLTRSDPAAMLVDAEILDREVSAAGEPARSPKLYGIVRSPRAPLLMPGAKSSPRAAEATVLDGALRRVAALLADDRVSLLGPGSTMQKLKQKLGFEGSPLGVDAVAQGGLLAKDVSESEILGLLKARRGRIVVSIVGGQGFLFGRGNQQLSPRVINAIGKVNIVIVSTMQKLAEVEAGCLKVDTGDERLDARLAGYTQVIVSSTRTVVMPVRDVMPEVAT